MVVFHGFQKADFQTILKKLCSRRFIEDGVIKVEPGWWHNKARSRSRRVRGDRRGDRRDVSPAKRSDVEHRDVRVDKRRFR